MMVFVSQPLAHLRLLRGHTGRLIATKSWCEPAWLMFVPYDRDSSAFRVEPRTIGLLHAPAIYHIQK